MDAILSKIRRNIIKVIRGKDDRVDLLLAALLARGHVLIEDMPGLGKTTLAKCMARSIDADFKRVQFTPDLLPTDILGGSVYNPREGVFTFKEGAIFTNVLLADEINRASPRTQSSLLEAMAERQVTIEGVRHPLPDLFMVVATQNPIEFHGTYPLPEAQLDRFLIRMTLDFPDEVTELAVLYDQQTTHPLDTLEAVVTRDEIVLMQQAISKIHVDEAVGRYIVAVTRETRSHELVQMGASPRGALGLFRLSQAIAAIAGRDHVRPDDVQQVAEPVLAHRIALDTKARYGGSDKASVIQDVLSRVRVPT